MSRKSVQKTIIIAAIALIVSLLLAPLALAAQDEMHSIQAPTAQPHAVMFETTGLPAGVSITINGTMVNPGGHTRDPFSKTFVSPGPSSNLATEPGTELIYSGFPALVSSGGVDYSLVSVTPASPFLSGLPGESTTVLATYETTITCLPAITTHPTSQAVTYGSPVTLTVAASGTAPLTYKWYKDLIELPGATLSEYSITSASMVDAGSYYVVVQNACGSATSNAATLTVNKANPTCLVTGYSVTYDGNPHTATGSCTGMQGESLSGLDLSGTVHTDAGSYTDSWSFTDVTGNYNNMGDTVSNVIAMADQTITFDQPASPVPFQGTFDINPTASSGLAVTVVATGACTLSGSTVTMALPFGSCTLTASQTGNSNYNPAVDVVRIVDLPYPQGLYLPLVLHQP